MSHGQAIAIVNPQSQNGTLGRKFSEIAKVVRREMGAFEHVMTEGPGDAVRLTREALQDGADLIIAVGGDGTVHEVTNGFFDTDGQATETKAALGVLPFGTGGDFRRSVPMPEDLAGCAQVLKQGHRKRIDVGHIEFAQGGRHGPAAHRFFINIASFGISGLVDRIVNSSSKALGGKASFFLGTARALLQYRNKNVRIVFDDDENDFLETRINNVAVANGQFFGGGMHIAPNARLDDGQFDVVVLGDLKAMRVLVSSPRVYQGTHLDMEKVSHRQAKKVEARPVDEDDEVLLDIDGEAPGALPATFTIRSQAISLVVPSPPA